MEGVGITLRLVGEPEDVPAPAFLEAVDRFLNIPNEVNVGPGPTHRS